MYGQAIVFKGTHIALAKFTVLEQNEKQLVEAQWPHG